MKARMPMETGTAAKRKKNAARLLLMERPGRERFFAIINCLVGIKKYYADMFLRRKRSRRKGLTSAARDTNREKRAASPGLFAMGNLHEAGIGNDTHFLSVPYLMQAFFDMPASRISGALCWMALNSS